MIYQLPLLPMTKYPTVITPTFSVCPPISEEELDLLLLKAHTPLEFGILISVPFSRTYVYTVGSLCLQRPHPQIQRLFESIDAKPVGMKGQLRDLSIPDFGILQ